MIHRFVWIGCLSGAAFPLFTTQMYKALDYKWANTLFGCLAAIMVPIPFVCLGPCCYSHYLFIVVCRSFSFMGQLFESGVSSRALLWAYRTIDIFSFDEVISLIRRSYLFHGYYGAAPPKHRYFLNSGQIGSGKKKKNVIITEHSSSRFGHKNIY